MIKGVIAGNFDVMHPGYIKMFKEAAANCDCLIVLLHTDPSIERPTKLKPVLTVEERKEMLMELKSICDVFVYTYEAQLLDLLTLGEFDIRFLGDDYIDKHYTGKGLPIDIKFIDRSHGWSTTKYKIAIGNSIKKLNI